MMNEWREHAELFKTVCKSETVVEIIKESGIFKLKTNQNTYTARAVIYGTGATHRHLGVKGEKEFASKGVSYCPTCDGMFFMGKTIAIVGGGDAALRGVQVMMRYADKIYLIHRRDEFRAEPILVDKIKASEKVEIITPANIKEIVGEQAVTGIELEDGRKIEINGIFIEVGSSPATELIKNLNVELDEAGYVKTNKDQSTNVEGLYAAGDVTTGSNKFRQVLTAASEGAIAADAIFKYLNK